MQPSTPESITFDVDRPDRPLDRFSSIFRLFFAVPILVVLAAIGGPGVSETEGDGVAVAGIAGAILFLPPLLTIVFRQKYPRWWFDFNQAYLAFNNRVIAYLLLLRDEYPSTDEEQAVHLHMPYPDVRTDLNRWMPLAKWFLAIPHYVVLFVLDIGVVLAAVAAWFSIAVTGRYPQGLFDFTVGVMRWHNRVVGYAFALVTDQYPPFRLSA
ncbi:MAG: DUF4389 domain-containing protein [Acidimicrobiales bacterium]